jgi:hypothetical protein
MDESVVAKIMSEFTEEKTARITQIMYAGTKKNVNTEEEVRKMLEEQQAKKENAQPNQQAQ